MNSVTPQEIIEDATCVNSARVTVESLTKRYGDQSVLQDFSLTLNGGETLALLGHNGAGKTTLIKLICGLITATIGSIRYHFSMNDQSANSEQWRYQLGYLPENIAFNQHVSGSELMHFFARLKHVDPSSCSELFDRVGLAQKDQSRAVREYSKGMRQRLGLAQALLGQPKLLLLDEPTSGLDPSVRRDIYRILNEYKSNGCSLLISSHSLDEIEHHCERVAMIKQGKLIAQGSRQELLTQAHLPIVIDITSAQINPLKTQLTNYHLEQYGPQQLRIHCERSQKMTLLKDLTQDSSISDLQVREPGLTDLYTYFCDADDR
ncbi:MAG: ABC transporter ATP-binding protein [Cellvibrionaceae bacterium]|nr:ABC transporter ATP-binding protein [Cellvibrionaceae bacterium]|tara:strand:+ start:6902 stop:7861 length:960 start_codon:yes stop_codon:yes gene_type:complete